MHLFYLFICSLCLCRPIYLFFRGYGDIWKCVAAKFIENHDGQLFNWFMNVLPIIITYLLFVYS